MGFAGYFLIVADFINWAKRNGVPVGPGRGSGAGSLVAYSLGITDLDPLRYALLFERFLNPERVSMPDFDIDFCQDGRDRVIDYVKKKYGADSVSQIATFGTMAAKAAVRDVGRVLDLPYMFCDGIAKLIPFQPGKLVTLKEARAMEPLLAEREQKEEEVRELLALAEPLEGLTRNVGMHAGGVLIAPGKLTDFCPLYTQAGVRRARLAVRQGRRRGGRPRQVRLPRPDDADDPRLDAALRAAPRPGDRRSTLETLPLDDKADLRHLQDRQHDGRVPVRIARHARPPEAGAADRFEDIIALVALYRPGPMELIPDYIARKPGRERVDYPDPRLEPILGPDLRRDGLPGTGDADRAGDRRLHAGRRRPPAPRDGQEEAGGDGAAPRHLRRRRARRTACTQAKATQLFDLMEKFAGYGFNKSHAAAYALVAYQTAYFKAHHPAAFMAANLSLVMDDTDKVRELYDDARRAAASRSCRPTSTRRTTASSRSTREQIRYGLGGIKGTGEQAIEAIVAARDAGGAVPRPLRFLPARRQARSSTGASSRR